MPFNGDLSISVGLARLDVANLEVTQGWKNRAIKYLGIAKENSKGKNSIYYGKDVVNWTQDNIIDIGNDNNENGDLMMSPHLQSIQVLLALFCHDCFTLHCFAGKKIY